MSQFAIRFKSISIGNEIITCSKSNAVIMAYWPGPGDLLTNIDYSKCRVGVIKYFIKHEIKFQNDVEEHVFCYIHWKQRHPHYDYFGQSAIVSSTLDEVETACCYMPVQRIACRCASAVLNVNSESIPETVFVACPVSLKYHI